MGTKYNRTRATIISFSRDDERVCSSRIILMKARTDDGNVVEIEWARELIPQHKNDFDAMWEGKVGDSVLLYGSSLTYTYCVPASVA